VISLAAVSPRPPRDFHASYGSALASRVRVVPYEELFAARRAPAGTWIFTDMDRLSARERDDAAEIWRRLEASGQAVRLLNHPLRVKRRHALLHALHEAGVNDFRAWRVDEPPPAPRFPVFLRVEDDHQGPRSELLHDGAALDAEAARLVAAGIARETLLVTEFCAEPDARGVYRKYGAYRVGARVFPNHLLFGRDWRVKRRDRGPQAAAAAAEERQLLERNPHEALLRRVFELAGIDYGRADYGVVRGRIQVYEINTNPTLMGPSTPEDADGRARKQHFANALVAALSAVELPRTRGAQVELTPTRRPRRRIRRFLRKLSERVTRPARWSE
jgi:hypothetical protein